MEELRRLSKLLEMMRLRRRDAGETRVRIGFKSIKPRGGEASSVLKEACVAPAYTCLRVASCS